MLIGVSSLSKVYTVLCLQVPALLIRLSVVFGNHIDEHIISYFDQNSYMFDCK